ncbi:hypothetical protein R3P38DRAFT_3211836 [Favolaschia claudopus]|uniref:Uncharacterized protein n=1 Tax=Favolaschia claudopus TaxID=2862362 RepID=A0AAW0AFD1_9AGAR
MSLRHRSHTSIVIYRRALTASRRRRPSPFDTKLAACTHLTTSCPRVQGSYASPTMPSITFPSLLPTAAPAHRIPRDTQRPPPPLPARPHTTPSSSSALDTATRTYTIIDPTPPMTIRSPVQDACCARWIGGRLEPQRGRGRGDEDGEREDAVSTHRHQLALSSFSALFRGTLLIVPPTSFHACRLLQGDNGGRERDAGRAYPLVLRSPACRRPSLVLIASCGTMVICLTRGQDEVGGGGCEGSPNGFRGWVGREHDHEDRDGDSDEASVVNRETVAVCCLRGVCRRSVFATHSIRVYRYPMSASWTRSRKRTSRHILIFMHLIFTPAFPSSNGSIHTPLHRPA